MGSAPPAAPDPSCGSSAPLGSLFMTTRREKFFSKTHLPFKEVPVSLFIKAESPQVEFGSCSKGNTHLPRAAPNKRVQLL